MHSNTLANEHITLIGILNSRGKDGLEKNFPIWKLLISDDEYDALKQTLRNNAGRLAEFGDEAAVCYAEWWRRDYKGGIPSKEEVATGLGIHYSFGDSLYKAARWALQKHGYNFIHSLKGTEYFRTLLNQGGLPINYIKSSDNFGCFSRFLKALVSELSAINYDWNSGDNSIIQRFNCISYLGKSFKNDNIYDVSMQIAHAIITGNKDLLPYDDTDASLAELTKSLETEYSHSKRLRRGRPLSLHWKLCVAEEGSGRLYVNLDDVKDISASSIPGLDSSTCYSFDVFVAGTLMGKYVRKTLVRDEDGCVMDVVYSRITMGKNQDVLWHGELVVEVKIRCDNDDRIFLTVAGCYPPNFEQPQVFQMLSDGVYSLGETANAECNLAVFSANWTAEGATPINISGLNLYCKKFTKSLVLKNEVLHETLTLTNKFTPYTAEFSDNYIPWVEKSNYKLLSRIPVVSVYDKDKNRVPNCRAKYRVRNGEDPKWHSLNKSCVLPCGLVDIRVDFPDGNSATESFYSIGDLAFGSANEEVFSTEITCSCSPVMRPEMERNDDIEIVKLADNRWRLSRNRDSKVCPSVCDFRLYNAGNPVLHISVPIPFDGVTITDIQGNIVTKGKIISFTNLTNYCIVSHGSKAKGRRLDVTYVSGTIEDERSVKHLACSVIDGRVSLADYSDLFTRMFNLYGANTFDRSSSVELNVRGTRVFIRKFILDSTIDNGDICVVDKTEYDTEGFIYDGDLYAFPVGDELPTDDFYAVKLLRRSANENLFSFPDDFKHQEVVVFSNPEARRRIVPKYYNRNTGDYDKDERKEHSSENTQNWKETLLHDDVLMGKSWRDVCKAFDICSQYYLPFTTYNGLKPISCNPELLAKFVIAMMLNDYHDVMMQDVDRFEQEMAVAIHWIPANVWKKCINELIERAPDPLKGFAIEKLQPLVELLQDLFSATISTDVASEFAAYLISDKIDRGKAFTKSDINDYRSKIHGLSDINDDLPTAKFTLCGDYYNRKQQMLLCYRVMIESAMCAAENACGGEVGLDLFDYNNRGFARVVNFYRKYFKETYSDIFFKTVKYIITSKS